MAPTRRRRSAARAPEARLGISTLDRCLPRRRLLDAVDRAKPSLGGAVLDVGAGDAPYRERLLTAPSNVDRYVTVDVPNDRYSRPDVCWDGLTLPFADGAFDTALATEVLEHCPDPARVVGEIRRVLSPGGTLFVTVPFLWPLHDAPHDHFRFTPFALEHLLDGAGFVDVRLEALGGWDASMAQLLGLWARRRLSGARRAVASAALLPVVAALDRIDRPPTAFTSSTMLSGLSGTARVPAR